MTLSASDTPLLVTVRVNVWLAPPAVTVALSKVLVTLSSTSSSTVVLVVLLVSLAGFGSSRAVGGDRGRVEDDRAGLGGLGQGDVDDERVITGAGREAGRVDAGHDLAERRAARIAAGVVVGQAARQRVADGEATGVVRRAVVVDADGVVEAGRITGGGRERSGLVDVEVGLGRRPWVVSV